MKTAKKPHPQAYKTKKAVPMRSKTSGPAGSKVRKKK
jgi:hypothetical protein